MLGTSFCPLGYVFSLVAGVGFLSWFIEVDGGSLFNLLLCSVFFFLFYKERMWTLIFVVLDIQ